MITKYTPIVWGLVGMANGIFAVKIYQKSKEERMLAKARVVQRKERKSK